MSCNYGVCGIYSLINKNNGHCYIGSSVNIGLRINAHKSELNRGKHPNMILRKAWDKYGENAFEIKVVAICPKEYLLKMEQWFIDNVKPRYNYSRIAGRAVTTHSEESKRKMSASRTGKSRAYNPKEMDKFKRLCHGENHPHRKLTWEQVVEIRERYSKGEKQHKLAKEFGVRQDNISLIVNNKIWQTATV